MEGKTTWMLHTVRVPREMLMKSHPFWPHHRITERSVVIHIPAYIPGQLLCCAFVFSITDELQSQTFVQLYWKTICPVSIFMSAQKVFHQRNRNFSPATVSISLLFSLQDSWFLISCRRFPASLLHFNGGNIWRVKAKLCRSEVKLLLLKMLTLLLSWKWTTQQRGLLMKQELPYRTPDPRTRNLMIRSADLVVKRRRP